MRTVVALLFGAVGLIASSACSSPWENRKDDPTSGYPPPFIDRDEFTHPSNEVGR